MNIEQVLDVLKQQVFDLFPDWEMRGLQPSDSLKDMGANSVDRAEILMLTMSALKVRAPMVEFAKAQNVGELVDIFMKKL